MTRRKVVLGPPGCGKTDRLLRLLDEELVGGVPPEQVAVLTFTRAARAEVVERVVGCYLVSDESLRWFRTIHSVCFRLLRLTRERVLNDEAYQTFARKYDYRLSPQGTVWNDLDDAPREAPHRTPDDLLRYVHEWGRNARLSRAQALARSPVERIVPRDFLLFEERLAAYKREHELCEFSDMLELVLAQRLSPDTKVVFVDEAQDLSPLQIAVVETWFTGAERVYIAGDDDQVIYRFQAANPDWLLSLASRGTPEILSQSYRVPVAVHAFAQKIIGRNRRRTAKEYKPTPRMGEVVQDGLRGAVARTGEAESVFVLVRNRAHIPRVAHELMEQDAVFRVSGPGGPNPLRSEGLMRALHAAQWLARECNSEQSVAALTDLLDRIPARGSVLPRGVKEKVARLERRGFATRQYALCELGLGPLADRIREQGPLAPLVKVTEESRRYVERLIAKHGEIPPLKVVLTTIHGAKGRQAHLVVLLSDMSRATFDAYQRGTQEEYESENRVFYVGVTRAIETLVLVEPNSKRHYDYPSLAGEEGKL